MLHRNNGPIVHGDGPERNPFDHLFTRPKRELLAHALLPVGTIARWPRMDESMHRAAPDDPEPMPDPSSATPPTRSWPPRAG